MDLRNFCKTQKLNFAIFIEIFFFNCVSNKLKNLYLRTNRCQCHAMNRVE